LGAGKFASWHVQILNPWVETARVSILTSVSIVFTPRVPSIPPKSLALEIDQTRQQPDAATASQLRRLVRDVLALVKGRPAEATSVARADIQFPLVHGAKPIRNEDVAELIPSAEEVRASALLRPSFDGLRAVPAQRRHGMRGSIYC
jgi:hypothetical protein